jgi:hypothetical protein
MLEEISILDVATFMVLYHLFCQYEVDRKPEKFRYYNALNVLVQAIGFSGIIVKLILG